MAGYAALGRLEGALDELAIEAQIAQEELRGGRITPAEVHLRFYRFAREVEVLSREGGRHLRVLRRAPEPTAAVAARAAA